MCDSDKRYSRKRFRGKRRYFKSMLNEAIAFSIRPAPDPWFDLWHYHADRPGWGNLSWKYRRHHLQALAVVFRKIASEAPRLEKPFQLWMLLSGRDAGEAAVYLHTPNPNSGSHFPVRLIHLLPLNRATAASRRSKCCVNLCIVAPISQQRP